NFIFVALWWLGFSQITFLKLPKYTFSQRKLKYPLKDGYKELRIVWNEFKDIPRLKRFLFSFFFIIMGVLTVMYMAANYGKKELGLDDDILISTILVIQVVGIIGSFGFARLSERHGNIPILMIIVFIWILICIGAWFVTDARGF